jgi:hypothetical protein
MHSGLLQKIRVSVLDKIEPDWIVLGIDWRAARYRIGKTSLACEGWAWY